MRSERSRFPATSVQLGLEMARAHAAQAGRRLASRSASSIAVRADAVGAQLRQGLTQLSGTSHAKLAPLPACYRVGTHRQALRELGLRQPEGSPTQPQLVQARASMPAAADGRRAPGELAALIPLGCHYTPASG